MTLEAESEGLAAESVHAKPENLSRTGIVFGAAQAVGAAPIPGYNAPAFPARPARDPALSLAALSGIDPTGPVMVEVPLVLNNTRFTTTQLLSGWRIGFADRYVQSDHRETVEHSEALCAAFDLLRQAGAQLVPVDAYRQDNSLQFTLQSNEIDDLVTAHRLDALVSGSESDAFHRACVSGYPSLSEPLGDGAKLWFYAARWSRDALPLLLRAYRQISTGALKDA
ncbi:hypothetical protein [Pseudomonas sp. L1(2025)]|uniref:hypothetical protein n=1 Tax=Pseudomonas sp. L1(2025) TaxID=3449429 RepID=UPI003F69300C